MSGLLALAAVVRLWDLGGESFWSDEIRTARLAALPMGGFLNSIFVEGNFAVPSLGILATRAASFFGDSEALLRLPSALFGLLGVLAIAGLARGAFGRTEAWVAALLLAAHHGHLYYSREARPYTLLAVFAILLVQAALRVIARGDGRSWLLLGAVAGSSLHASFLAVIPATACLLASVLARLGRAGEAPRAAIALLAVAGMALPLVLGGAVFDIVGGGTPPLPFAPGAVEGVLHLLGPGWGVGALAAGALLLLGAWAAARENRPLALVGAVHVVVTCAVFAATPTRHGFVARYVFFLLPLIVVFQARGLTRLGECLRSTWRRSSQEPSTGATSLAARSTLPTVVLPALALVAAALNAPAWSSSFSEVRRDWRGAARAVVERIPHGALVLSTGIPARRPSRDLTPECLGYYLGDRDGFSMPDNHRILVASETGGPGLDLRGWVRGRSVCALLVHRRASAAPVAKAEDVRDAAFAGVDVHALRGLTLLFPADPTWRTIDQTALLLLSAGGVTLHRGASGRLLQHGVVLAGEARDPEVRRVLANALGTALLRRVGDVSLEDPAALARFDALVGKIQRLDPAPDGGMQQLFARLLHVLDRGWRAEANRARERGDPLGELIARAMAVARAPARSRLRDTLDLLGALTDLLCHVRSPSRG